MADLSRADLRRLVEERIALAERATHGVWTARMWTEGHPIGLVHRDGMPIAAAYARRNNDEDVANRALIAHAGTHDLALMRAIREMLTQEGAQ